MWHISVHVMYQTINVWSVNITITWSNSAAAGGLMDSLVAPRSECKLDCSQVRAAICMKWKFYVLFPIYAIHYTAIISHRHCRPCAEMCLYFACVKACYVLSTGNTRKKNKPKIRILGLNFRNLHELCSKWTELDYMIRTPFGVHSIKN